MKKLFWGYELNKELTEVSIVAVVKDHTSMVLCPKCGSINNYQQKYCGGCGSKFKFFTLENYKKLNAKYEEQKREKQANQLTLFDKEVKEKNE